MESSLGYKLRKLSTSRASTRAARRGSVLAGSALTLEELVATFTSLEHKSSPVGQIKVRSIDIGQRFVHILSMQAVSYSEARENLKAMIDKVVADRAPLAITRQRGEGAVLVSESEWASIEETLYLLRSPKNAKRLLESIAELEAGGGEVHELIEP